jgi:hypothetical protein
MASLPPEASLEAWQAAEELQRQKNVVDARLYYRGIQGAMLTERQKEFLGFNQDNERFALNYCPTVVDAVTERLIIESFIVDDETLSAAIAEWWRDNRMDLHQQDVHDGAVKTGESFLIVDWDEDEKRPRFSPHPRYTDPMVRDAGTGFGCKAHYPDDNPALPMRFASKRWLGVLVESGRARPRQMMTLYYPERVERYFMAGEGEATWQLLEEPLPWTMNGQVGGEPIGIPVIHFRNPSVKSELWDAIPIQDLINKTSLDIIAAADAAGFPMVAAKGFMPTTDGKDPSSTGTNAIKLYPGVWIPIPEGGDIEVIRGSDLGPMLETLDSWVIKLAQVTRTPLSRFQVTALTPRAETLKQQDGPLLNKIEKRQVRFGNSWEDSLTIATRIANANGESLALDEHIESVWRTAETRDELGELKQLWDAAKTAGEAGVPLIAFLKLQGWAEDRIEMIETDPQFMARTMMLTAAAGAGGG